MSLNRIACQGVMLYRKACPSGWNRLCIRSLVTQGEKKEFDIVVYGASGYTGRLVAEYLHQV